MSGRSRRCRGQSSLQLKVAVAWASVRTYYELVVAVACLDASVDAEVAAVVDVASVAIAYVAVAMVVVAFVVAAAVVAAASVVEGVAFAVSAVVVSVVVAATAVAFVA